MAHMRSKCQLKNEEITHKKMKRASNYIVFECLASWHAPKECALVK